MYVFFGQRFRRNLKLLLPRCLRGVEVLPANTARGIEITTAINCPRRGSSVCITSSSCLRTIYRAQQQTQQAQAVIQQTQTHSGAISPAGARHGSLSVGLSPARLTLTVNANGINGAANLSHSPTAAVGRMRSNTGSCCSRLSFRGTIPKPGIKEEHEPTTGAATESATVTASASASASASATVSASASSGVCLGPLSSQTSCDTLASNAGLHRGVNRLSSHSSYLSTASYTSSFRERESTKRILS